MNKLYKMFEKIRSRSDARLEKEFLPEALEIVEKPSSPIGHFAIWITTAILAVFLLWSIFGKVDEVAFARGKVISVDGLQTLQPVSSGTVTDIMVKEGESVKAGQKLICLDSSIEEITKNNTENGLQLLNFKNKLLGELLEGKDISLYLKDNQDEDKKIIIEYVSAIQKNYITKREQIDLTILQNQKQVAVEEELLLKLEVNKQLLLEQQNSLKITNTKDGPEKLTLVKLEASIASTQKEADEYQILYDNDAITKIELEEKQNELDGLKKEYDVQKVKADNEKAQQDINLKNIQGQIDLATKDYDVQKKTVEKAKDTLSQSEKSLGTLNADNIQTISNLIVENNKEADNQESNLKIQTKNFDVRTLVSPVNGIVKTLSVNTIGGVVTSAQPVITIVPDNAQLIVEADLLNRDIGFITIGQDVAVKIDTFTFQKYGKFNGKVIFISPDAILDEKKGLIYKIKVSLDKSQIPVNGKDVSIVAGMEGVAEIKISDRRIIEFFLEPIIEHFDESLKVR